ncbi:GlsB/YeaQ/YmgE family stress response membrane protein [Siccirubricoccus deserti]
MLTHLPVSPPISTGATPRRRNRAARPEPERCTARLARSDEEVGRGHHRYDRDRLPGGAGRQFLHPGRDPAGFIITTLLGIVGALVATYLGQAVGWYRAGKGRGSSARWSAR